jgi:dihydrofolate reductase
VISVTNAFLLLALIASLVNGTETGGAQLLVKGVAIWGDEHSPRLVQTLIDHDLVDEFQLMVFPVVLGSGKRLFGETSDKKPLRLVDSKVVGDGVTILVYAPADSKSSSSTS